MSSKISATVDVAELEQAIGFYTQALGFALKTRVNAQWAVLSLDGFDVHLLEKAAGTEAAGSERRRYERHWTPVHLDFGVPDVRAAVPRVETLGGVVEGQSFSEEADIAFCADPFGNGFCLIRE